MSLAPSKGLHPLLAKLIRAHGQHEKIDEMVQQVIDLGLIEERVPVPQTGCSLLTWLIEKQHTPQAMRLLEAGADPLHPSDAGYQAIHAAAAFNNLDLTKALLRRGASLHAQTHDKATAVHFALTDELDVDFVEWLLDRIEAPSHALMKKAGLGFSESASVWVLMARYGRSGEALQEVLESLDRRGLIDGLLQSDKRPSRDAAQQLQHEIIRRFKGKALEGWWKARSSAKSLDDQTPTPQRPGSMRRF